MPDAPVIDAAAHNAANAPGYDGFKTWDIGDIIGVEGDLFKTNTGELAITVTEAYLLSKPLTPLTVTHHGFVEVEHRYRT